MRQVDLFSVTIYLLTFFVSFLLFEISDKNMGKKKSILIAFVGIFVLSVVAGIRADDVGKDIQVYVTNWFAIIDNTSSFKQALIVTQDSNLEFLYVLLVFLCSRVTNDAGLVLFFLQFLTVIPLYFTARIFSRRKICSVTTCMVIYMFCFYNNSLNIMRQSIAVAFVILAYMLYKEEKYKRCILVMITAILFHKSTIIGVTLIIFAVYFSKCNKYKKMFIIGLILLIPLLIRPVSGWVLEKGIINSSFEYYINVFVYQTIETDWMVESYNNSMVFEFIAKTIMMMPFLLIKNNTNEMKEIKNICWIGYIIYVYAWLVMKTSYGGRVSLYSEIFLVPVIAYCFEKNFTPKWLSRLCLLFVLLIYWYVWIFLVGSSASSIYRIRY